MENHINPAPENGTWCYYDSEGYTGIFKYKNPTMHGGTLLIMTEEGFGVTPEGSVFVFGAVENSIVFTIATEEQVKRIIKFSKVAEKAKPRRFEMPTEKELIDIAISINDGVYDDEQITRMTSMCNFVINRLFENGDILKKSSKEL